MAPRIEKLSHGSYGSAEEAGLLLSADDFDYSHSRREVETRTSALLGMKGKAILLLVAVATIVFAVAKSTSSVAQMKGSSNFAVSVGSNSETKKFESWIPRMETIAGVAPYAKSTKTFFAIGAYNPQYPRAQMQSPWDMVLEPHREMNIVLSYNALVAAGLKGVIKVEITIDGDTFSAIADKDGHYVGKYTTTHYGKVFDGCVCKVVTEDGSVFTRTFSAAAKYVRREIRSLIPEEKTRFMDAMKVVYDYKNEDMYMTKYGAKFKSIKYFQEKHLNGAGTTDCDHWHDGAGMLNKHVAISLEMEQSLQAVDPILAMPYWEYSYDAENLGDNWMQSELLSNEYFGGEGVKSDPNRAIPDSYFAGLEVPDGAAYTEWDVASTGTLNPFVNAYGQLRTPWNQRSDSYVSRNPLTYEATVYDSFPGCSTVSTYYNTKTLGRMMNGLNGALHGPVHILIGGAWSDEGDSVNELFSTFKSTQRILYFKIMWRAGITRCPTSCDEGEACVCSIPDWVWKSYTIDEMLTTATILPTMQSTLSDWTHQDKKELLKYLASVYNVGDMLTSSAAYDPTFWPLHGQIEKLVGLKRINTASGTDSFDMTLAFTGSTIALEGVCDWSDVATSETEVMPACDSTASCYGHGDNDLLEFFGFDEDYTLSWTNQEFLDWIDPWNDQLPYVYDTFKFDYCDDTGYPVGVDGVDYLNPYSENKPARRSYTPKVRTEFKSDKDMQTSGIFGYRAQKARKASKAPAAKAD